MRIIILSVMLLFFVSCSLVQNTQANNNTKGYDISNISVYDVGLQKEIPFDKFISTLNTYDIVMLGEKHDEKKHHAMQNEILKRLSENRKVYLVLEMFGTNMQKTIDSAEKNKANIKPNSLQKEIGWDKKWDYSQYKDIMQTAFFSDNVKIKAGNISQDEIMTIYEGVMPIRGDLSTRQEVKDKIAKVISQTHHIDDKEMIDKLVEIQQYKDRRMADVLVNTDDFCIFLAGFYHVSKDMGVPLHIKDYKSSKKVAVVGMSDSLQDKQAKSDFIILFK